MEEGEREKEESIKALRLCQDMAMEAASDLWGYINEEAGAELLERFVAEKKIQSFVLAARGSFLDGQGVDAVLCLWNHSYLPINFKSSEWGKEKHEGVRHRYSIPCLVVNRAKDPEFLRSSKDLMRLIESWYERFSFSNDMLIPCARLKPWSAELLQLRDEVSDSLLLLVFERATVGGCVLTWPQALHCVRRKYGYVNGKIGLSTGEFVGVELYRWSRVMSWVGKRSTVLIALPKVFVADELRTALEVGMRKAKKI